MKEGKATKQSKQPTGQKERRTKDDKEFSDSYIKKLLCMFTILKPSDIPEKLVRLKRQHLILEQTIKNYFGSVQNEK